VPPQHIRFPEPPKHPPQEALPDPRDT
jgi:hypothetical protein